MKIMKKSPVMKLKSFYSPSYPEIELARMSELVKSSEAKQGLFTHGQVIRNPRVVRLGQGSQVKTTEKKTFKVAPKL